MATKYTEAQVDTMVGNYNAAVEQGADYAARTTVVKELATEMGFSEGQVRSKLVAEGVYKGKEKVKAADGKSNVGTKEDYRKAFEAATGLALASMENMTKKDLVALWEWKVNTFDRAVADAGTDA